MYGKLPYIFYILFFWQPFVKKKIVSRRNYVVQLIAGSTNGKAQIPSAGVDARTTAGLETGATKNGCHRDQAWV
jgi:hypothetical protein